MRKPKVLIVGNFAYGKEELGGQQVKTRELDRALREEFAPETADSYRWQRRPCRFLRELVTKAGRADAVVMLPGPKGLYVFTPLLARLQKSKKFRLYYDVIGGWLPEVTRRHPRLARRLRALDGVWAETETMRRALIDQGFANVAVVPNFKDFEPVDIAESAAEPAGGDFPVCTFSRVTAKKGIADAIAVVARLRAAGRPVRLDVYGVLEEAYRPEFETLLAHYLGVVAYRGVADSRAAVETLRPYRCLLFPTLSPTEGIPGTILDAYAAGVPVVCYRWRSTDDLVTDGETGLVVDAGDRAAMEERLRRLLDEPELGAELARNGLARARLYTRAAVAGRIASILRQDFGTTDGEEGK